MDAGVTDGREGGNRWGDERTEAVKGILVIVYLFHITSLPTLSISDLDPKGGRGLL